MLCTTVAQAAGFVRVITLAFEHSMTKTHALHAAATTSGSGVSQLAAYESLQTTELPS